MKRYPKISKLEAGRVLLEVTGALLGSTVTAIGADVLGAQLVRRAAERSGIALSKPPAKPAEKPEPSPTTEWLDRVRRYQTHLDKLARDAEGADDEGQE